MSLIELIEKENNRNIKENDVYLNDVDLVENTITDVSNRELIVRKASQVQHEPMQWLWKGWLALGKLHILAGAPGAGKTTIAMDVAAIITTGKNWPDDASPITGEVLIWSSEDS